MFIMCLKACVTMAKETAREILGGSEHLPFRIIFH